MFDFLFIKNGRREGIRKRANEIKKERKKKKEKKKKKKEERKKEEPLSFRFSDFLNITW